MRHKMSLWLSYCLPASICRYICVRILCLSPNISSPGISQLNTCTFRVQPDRRKDCSTLQLPRLIMPTEWLRIPEYFVVKVAAYIPLLNVVHIDYVNMQICVHAYTHAVIQAQMHAQHCR